MTPGTVAAALGSTIPLEGTVMSKPTCATPDCGKPKYCRGLCRACYARLYRSEDFVAQTPAAIHHRLSDVDVDLMEATCSICGPVRVMRKSKQGGKFRYKCRTTEVARSRKRAKARRESTEYDPAAQRRYELKRLYGLSEEDYNAMYAAQNGCCAICRKLSKTVLHVDHCHETGRVRGLLCFPCNTSIGRLGDRLESVLAAAEYLGARIDLG